MTEKCFKKCIVKPGTTLDSTEQVNFFCRLMQSLSESFDSTENHESGRNIFFADKVDAN